MATSFDYFSKNGQILPIEQAVIPLSNIEYSYGFGVYETLKVRHGILYFVKQHINRLFISAEIIGITHSFTKDQITTYIEELLAKLEVDACNIKMLLIGGKEPQLFIQALAPLFPDRKLYSEGAKVVTISYERQFPNAKSLNMLGSYIAYKKAKKHDAYDALCLNKEGNVVEGTRTTFFAIKNKTLFTAPLAQVLDGITRQTVLHVAKEHGYEIKETNIALENLDQYDGAFLTSTSIKIMPITQIDEFVFSQIPTSLKELMKLYDTFLEDSHGIFIS